VDSGGLSLATKLTALALGISWTEDVLAGTAECQSWDRETLGAEIRREQTRISAHHDDHWVHEVPTESFRKALCAWLAFMKLPPDVNRRVEVEI
jgi:hypothetical protein